MQRNHKYSYEFPSLKEKKRRSFSLQTDILCSPLKLNKKNEENFLKEIQKINNIDSEEKKTNFTTPEKQSNNELTIEKTPKSDLKRASKTKITLKVVMQNYNRSPSILFKQSFNPIYFAQVILTNF